MDPKNQPQSNPAKEQTGFVPPAPKLSDVVANLNSGITPAKTARIEKTPVPPESENSATPADHIKIIKTYKSDVEKAMKAQGGPVAKTETPPQKKQEQVVTAVPPQFNARIPLSEILRQDQAGFVPTKVPETNEVSANVAPIITKEHETIVRTYKSDAAEAAKDQQQSVAKIALAQEEMRRERGEEIGAEPIKKRKIGLLLTAIILIAVGVAAIPTVQYILNQKKREVSIVAEKTIIPFDNREILTLESASRTNFINELNELRAKTPAASTIEYIKVQENILDEEQKTITRKVAPEMFARMIGPNMPAALVRSFDSDYMFGAKDSTNPKPFILFKTSSYQLTFANMLRFEEKMTADLNSILNIDQNAFGKPFTDKVVANKDIRAITSGDDTIILLYGFLDNKTLIITTDAQTFQDINNRYVAAQFVQ